MNSIWKIAIYDGVEYPLYSVCIEGFIKNNNTGKILSTPSGRTVLYKEKIKKGIHLSKLIKNTFYPIVEETLFLKDEIWKSLLYKGTLYLDFKISNLGRIKDCKKNIIKQPYTSEGYKKIYFCKNQAYIHRLVAETFLSNTEDKPTVNHIDGDKSNNNVLNLEWATFSENNQHAYDSNLKNTKHIEKLIEIIETKMQFNSIINCAIFLKEQKYSKANIENIASSITKSIKLNNRPYLGFTFKFLD